jgi:hypothetical protein
MPRAGAAAHHKNQESGDREWRPGNPYNTTIPKPVSIHTTTPTMTLLMTVKIS